MARPKKKSADRKIAELRISVTAEQKKTITRAATHCGMDVAVWARQILSFSAADALVRKPPSFVTPITFGVK